MTALVCLGALLLAFVNGANDNMKGVATLYGSGALSYRRALALASVATALGGLVSLVVSVQLVHTFSGKGLIPDAMLSEGVLAAVALAATAAVLLATRLGLPVSTTHALLGALLGAGAVAAGSALDLGVLGGAFVLPLLLSPLVAVGTALAIVRSGRRLATGLSARQAVHGAHVTSAALVCFARGLNDTPKILGLVVGASAMGAATGALAITAAMVLGGVVAAGRVTRTIAHDITPMRPETGLAGNLATAALVLGASRLGLPVSTTHVSVGSILGIGAEGASLRGPTVRRIAVAWVGTLPIAAVFGAGLAAWLAGCSRCSRALFCATASLRCAADPSRRSR